MKVLVTGASGFIGNYVVKELLRNKIEVIASSSNKYNASQKEWFEEVNYIPLDFGFLDEKINYYEFFGEPDAMIHLAWEGLPNYTSDFHINDNLPRHFALLTNLVRGGLKNLTITGTCFEYGIQNGCLVETTVSAPANPYAIAKDNLRRMLEEYKKENPFELKWVRLFYIYGMGQNPKSLFSQLNNAIENGETSFNMSGGEQIRDFMPVEKVAENVVDIALQNKILGIINCSSNQPITVKQFVINYLKERKVTISLNLGFYPYASYEPMAFWGDNSLLKKVTKNKH